MKKVEVFRATQVECPGCGEIYEIDESYVDVEEYECQEEGCDCVFMPVENL